jgi:hypothetical protein
MAAKFYNIILHGTEQYRTPRTSTSGVLYRPFLVDVEKTLEKTEIIGG